MDPKMDSKRADRIHEKLSVVRAYLPFCCARPPFCVSQAEGKRTSKEEMSSVSCTIVPATLSSKRCSSEAGDLDIHTFTYIHYIFYFFQIKNTTCPRIAYASLGGSC